MSKYLGHFWYISYMNKENNLNLEKTLVDIVAFKTISGNHEEVKKAYDYIEKLFPVELFDFQYIINNNFLSQVIAFRGVDWRNAKLIINGHIDVIDAPDNDFISRIENNIMYGRGTSDMKAGLVATISAMLRLAQEKKNIDCAFIITSDEEIGGDNGVGKLINEIGSNTKFVLVTDGPRHDQMLITTREKGILWLEVSVAGKASHAARPWLGKNAVHLLLDFLSELRDLVGRDEKDEWKSVITVSKIGTSNSTNNRVPSDAMAVVDIRFTEALANNKEELFEKIKNKTPEGIEVKIISGGGMINTDITNPYMVKLQEAMNISCGKEIPFGYGHAGSDGRFFSEKNIPVALIGTFGANWHAPNEWVDLNSLYSLEKSIFQFISNFDSY